MLQHPCNIIPVVLSCRPTGSFRVLFLSQPLYIRCGSFFHIFITVIHASLIQRFICRIGLQMLYLCPHSCSDIRIRISRHSSPGCSYSGKIELFNTYITAKLKKSSLFHCLGKCNLCPDVFCLCFFTVDLAECFYGICSTFLPVLPTDIRIPID